MTYLDSQHVDHLRSLIGDSAVRAGDLAGSLDPGMHPKNLDADVIVFPASKEDVATVLEYCCTQDIEVVPQGGRTGLSGATRSSPGQLIVSLARMNRIIDLDFIAGTAVVEAGVTLQQLQDEISPHGYGAGIDLAARGSATLGGMVSTNAGGTEAFRYGTMRNRVLGMEVVLADGRVMDDMKFVVKANEGYEIRQLFIGAEGTLGIVTRIVLNLAPDHQNRASAMISCANALSAATLFRELRTIAAGRLLCAEIMWPDYARTTAEQLGLERLLDFAHSPDDVFIIIDVTNDDSGGGVDFLNDTLSDLLAREMMTSALIAQNERERADFWKVREESFLCDKRYPHGYWYDVSVPLGHLDEYTDALFRTIREIDQEVRVFLFGHLGDGNLHLTITRGTPCPELATQIDAAVYSGLREIGGSFSAEHGIGEEKAASLVKYGDPVKLATMGAIKQALDPKGIMNPGKIVNPGKIMASNT